MILGRLRFFYWEGHLSGAMLNFRSVNSLLFCLRGTLLTITTSTVNQCFGRAQFTDHVYLPGILHRRSQVTLVFYNFGHEPYEEVAVLGTIRMRMKDVLCQEDHQALRDSAAGSLHVLLLRQGQQSARGCNMLSLTPGLVWFLFASSTYCNNMFPVFMEGIRLGICPAFSAIPSNIVVFIPVPSAFKRYDNLSLLLHVSVTLKMWSKLRANKGGPYFIGI